MKKTVMIAALLLVCAGFMSAQTATASTTSSEPEIPLRLKLMDKMGRPSFNRYVLLPTSSSSLFYELDTVTGRIWIMEFGYRPKDRRKIAVNDEDLRMPFEKEEEIIGRFEMIPTNHSCFYLMIDGRTGRTWQIEQPNLFSSKKERLVEEIQ